MADTDYDAPRVREGDASEPQELEELGLRTRKPRDNPDEHGQTPPGEAGFLDRLSDDDTELPVSAQRVDEFACSKCFLIMHRRRYARTLRGRPVCRDCS